MGRPERECLVNGKARFLPSRFYDPQADALFRNNGDGTFTDARRLQASPRMR